MNFNDKEEEFYELQELYELYEHHKKNKRPWSLLLKALKGRFFSRYCSSREVLEVYRNYLRNFKA